MTQHAGTWGYKKVMRELDRQSSRKKIDVKVGDQTEHKQFDPNLQ